MGNFTVFTLAGPFASFGTVAGNERRGTADRPGHSMLVGLLAAALGIRRDEADRLAALSDACRFAVRTDTAGALFTDYHTVQSAKRRRGFAPATRREMLAIGNITTTITKREYLAGSRFTAALSLAEETYSHAAIVGALKRPVFTLYLGRKSCPPALPLDPDTVEADGAAAALALYDRDRADRFWPTRRPVGGLVVDARLEPGMVADETRRQETRRTRPRDRRAWTFDLLDELVLPPPEPQAEADKS